MLDNWREVYFQIYIADSETIPVYKHRLLFLPAVLNPRYCHWYAAAHSPSLVAFSYSWVDYLQHAMNWVMTSCGHCAFAIFFCNFWLLNVDKQLCELMPISDLKLNHGRLIRRQVELVQQRTNAFVILSDHTWFIVWYHTRVIHYITATGVIRFASMQYGACA